MTHVHVAVARSTRSAVGHNERSNRVIGLFDSDGNQMEPFIFDVALETQTRPLSYHPVLSAT